MARISLAVIGLAVASVAILVIWWVVYVYPHGELADYRGWSVLQGMDDPRPDVSASTILMRKDEFAVLGVRGVGEMKGGPVYGPRQPRWSWVLLNEHDADAEVKQMPEFPSYELPCSELRRVERAVPDIDASAMRYLTSICR